MSVIKRTIERDLAILRKNGVIARKGNTRTGKWIVKKKCIFLFQVITFVFFIIIIIQKHTKFALKNVPHSPLPNLHRSHGYISLVGGDLHNPFLERSVVVF